jgi:hypothetical protein
MLKKASKIKKKTKKKIRELFGTPVIQTLVELASLMHILVARCHIMGHPVYYMHILYC